MKIETIFPEDAVEILERRGLHFRRVWSRWLAHCPLHADSKPSLSVWRGRDGGAVISCWPCGFHDTLPRFLCRLAGQEPRGQVYLEALRECGFQVEDDGKPRSRFKRRWSAWEHAERATTPLALACQFPNPADALKRFTEAEVKSGHSPEGPYVRRLVAAVAFLEGRNKR